MKRQYKYINIKNKIIGYTQSCSHALKKSPLFCSSAHKCRQILKFNQVKFLARVTDANNGTANNFYHRHICEITFKNVTNEDLPC